MPISRATGSRFSLKTVGGGSETARERERRAPGDPGLPRRVYVAQPVTNGFAGFSCAVLVRSIHSDVSSRSLSDVHENSIGEYRFGYFSRGFCGNM